MRDYKKFVVWEKSVTLVTDIYKALSSFPQTENYGLSSQIKRASVSVPSNIAEGCSKDSSADFKRFLQFSLGSTYELETQLIIALNLKYLGQEVFDSLYKRVREIGLMLTALMKSL